MVNYSKVATTDSGADDSGWFKNERMISMDVDNAFSGLL